jgi:hypothetical protein
MSKRQFLCVLGIWVAIFLFLGLPTSWDKPIAVITGLIIVIAAYTLPAPRTNIERETFTENKQP